MQHIGSTSVPGLDAKPIINIGEAVANFGEAIRCVEPLELHVTGRVLRVSGSRNTQQDLCG
jgi:GrpB-like predicted nucleotidyltransferase (UPF0157 family)